MPPADPAAGQVDRVAAPAPARAVVPAALADMAVVEAALAGVALAGAVPAGAGRVDAGRVDAARVDAAARPSPGLRGKMTRVAPTGTDQGRARHERARGQPAEAGRQADLIHAHTPRTRARVTDISHQVELHGAGEVARALRRVMPGWHLTHEPQPADAGRPVSRVEAQPDGSFRLRSWWSRDAWCGIGLAGATCGVVADLTQAFCDERPGTLALHCGAVRIGGHLVALTGTHRAGKSTLVARLSAESDLVVFGDDILPILPDGAAWALGIQPRLRLPLPARASFAFRTYVEQHMSVRDDRYGYVDAPTLAPRGTRAPLAAIVVLDRQPEGAACLHRVESAEAASHLIRQNIADPGEIEEFYDQVIGMATGLCCLKLRYSDLEDAVALLRQVFDGDQVPSGSVRVDPPLPPDPGAEEAEPADLSRRYTRSGNVISRQIESDLFLWHIEDRNFFGLNVVGAAVWLLLEAPASGLEVAGALAALFPEVPRDTLDRDAAALLGVLLARNLVTVQ